MKKHLLSTILLIGIISILLVSCNTNAEASKLEYKINDDGRSITITGIGEYVRTDVDIPGTIDGYTVTAIAPKAFSKSNITSIALPKTLEEIGYEAFLDCKELRVVRFPWGNKSIKKLESRTFKGCTALHTVDMPECLEEISDVVFYGCEYLVNIEIPKSVKAIGSNTFESCYSLQKIELPDGIKSIEPCLFRNCKSLKKITLPENLESIGKRAFQYCFNLSGSIVIPNSVTSIGASAFDNCQRIEELILPTGITEINDYSFVGCLALRELIIPEGVTELGNYAFDACYSLENLSLPSTLRDMGIYSLTGALNVQNIEVSADNPAYCSIDGNLYSKNGEILIQYALGKPEKEFSIPSHVKIIGRGAFIYAQYLEIVNIPKSVTTIRPSAFTECRLLTAINYEGTVAEWVTIVKDPSWNYKCGDYKVYCSNGITK